MREAMHASGRVGEDVLYQQGMARDKRVWESNFALLRSGHPEVASLLANGPSNYPVKIAAVQTRSGLATLAAREGEGGWIHLHSAYDPISEARRWVDHAAQGDWRIAGVLGFGLGYHVEELMKRFPNRRVVVIEPNVETLRVALGVRDLRALLASPKFDLLVTEDAKQAGLLAFQRISQDLVASPMLLAWPPTQRLWHAFWEVFRQQILDLTRAHTVNVATFRRFSVQWLVNFFANLRLSAGDPSVVELMEPFIGRPAIIVSAGPSLDKNVELLHEAKGRALIVAAGSAINPLIRHGVKPDLLVSIDPGPANYKHFENLDGRDMPLIYPPTIFPRIVHEYRGPRWVAGLDSFPFTSWALEKLGSTTRALASGPSVANTAWDLVRQMGCNPIIFVGQDLAYTDLKSHAEGATHRRVIANPEGDARYLYVEDVHGGKVVTDRPMNAMKVWFERKILSAGTGQHFVDATEGGARIAGTEVMPLREVLARYCRERFDPYEKVMEIHRREAARLPDRGAEQQLSAFFAQVGEDLERVGQISWQAEKVGRSLLRKAKKRTVSPRHYTEAHQAFSRLDRELTALPSFRMLIRPVLSHVVENVNRVLGKRLEHERDLPRKAEQLVTTYASLFNAAARTASQIQELIRLEQEGPGPA